MSQGTNEGHGDEAAHACGPVNTGDSAGQPWAGRSFQTNPHAGDDGSADPALDAALKADRAGGRSAAAVVDALRSARVLIPLIAEKGQEGVGPTGLTVDKTQELSIVTVAAPDGRAVLPIFSSVAAMTAWDSSARPVPSDGTKAALAAASEQTELIVIDPGSETEFVVRRPAIWAMAQQQEWEPSYLSPDVFRGFQESIGTELAVLDLQLVPGDPQSRLRGPELIVRLRLMEGLTKEELDATLSRLASRWAADDRIATTVDSLTVKIHSGEPEQA